MNEHGVADSRLTVIQIQGVNARGEVTWLCECNCDKHTKFVTTGYRIRTGIVKSCGCILDEIRRSRFINMTGWKMWEHGVSDSRLTVLRQEESKNQENSSDTYWLCECNCGNHKQIIVRGTDLRQGRVRSCGCLFDEYINDMRDNSCKSEKLYAIWCGIKGRCYVESNSSYKNYGGRGIQVCDEWKNSYSNFKNWAINNGYNENAMRGECTIERIDVNGNYCPNNCKFVTSKEQANNRRSNRLITINGVTKNITEWADAVGLTNDCIYARLKLGWTEYNAVMTPKGGRGGAGKM